MLSHSRRVNRQTFRDFLMEVSADSKEIADFIGNTLTGNIAELQLTPERIGVFKGRYGEPSKLTGTQSVIYLSRSPHLQTNVWQELDNSTAAAEDSEVIITGGAIDLSLRNDPASNRLMVKQAVVDYQNPQTLFENHFKAAEHALAPGLLVQQDITLRQLDPQNGSNGRYVGQLLLHRELLGG